MIILLVLSLVLFLISFGLCIAARQYRKTRVLQIKPQSFLHSHFFCEIFPSFSIQTKLYHYHVIPTKPNQKTPLKRRPPFDINQVVRNTFHRPNTIFSRAIYLHIPPSIISRKCIYFFQFHLYIFIHL